MKKIFLIIIIVLMIVSVSVITYKNNNPVEEPIHTEGTMI